MDHASPETSAVSGRWSAVASVTLTLVILTFPLPRHWWLLDRPLPADVYYEFTAVLFYLSDAAVLLLIAAAFVSLVVGESRFRWEPAAITLPLALLALRALISVAWAEESGVALALGVRLVLLFLLYLAIVWLRPSLRLVQWSAAAGAVLQAVVALGQFALQHDLGLRFLGEIYLEARPTVASIITVGNRVWLRGYGLTPHPNILGGVLACALVVLSVAFLQSRGRGRIIWLVVLGIAAAGLAVSFSRGAWLGAAVGAGVMALGILAYSTWRRQYGRRLLSLAAAGLMVAALFVLISGDLLLARLRPAASTTETQSLDERQVLTNASLVLIQQEPLRGVGAGNFSTSVRPLVQDVPGVRPQPVHNVLLLVTAEMGVAGGALWLWLTLAPLVMAWRRLRAGRLALWALGLTAALVALAVIDLVDFYSWGWSQGRALHWLFWGLWAAALETT